MMTIKPEMPKKDMAYARNYSFEVRIGGPNRGDVMIIKGDSFKYQDAVIDAMAAFSLLANKVGVDAETIEKIMKNRILGMV